MCTPGDAALESTCYIIRQMEGFSQSCHRTRASEQERRQVSIISDDGSFCARRLTARQVCVPAYRTHIVGFACYFDRACVISVHEFQHFGCGCVFFKKKTFNVITTCACRTFSRSRAIRFVAQRV